MGSITESTLEQYSALGYDAATTAWASPASRPPMEEQLSANVAYRQGSQEVEVDANGAVMRELSYEAPVNGNSVQLTIDIEMQQILEESLQYNIEEAQKIQMEELANASASELENYQEQIANRDGEPLRPGGDGRGRGAGRAHGRGPGHGQLPGL